MKSQGLRRTRQLSITWVNSKLNLLNIEHNFSNLHLKEENRIRIRGQQVRKRQSLHDRLSLSRKIDPSLKYHRHSLTLSSILVHNTNMHSWCYPLQRRQNSTPRSSRYHRRSSRRKRKRKASYRSS